MRRQVKIKFLSEWQIATGFGDGCLSDNDLAQDEDGFLYIPGSALKGFLREAAGLISNCIKRDDLKKAYEDIFGTGACANKENIQGLIKVGCAYLPQDFKEFLKSYDDQTLRSFQEDMIAYRTAIALNAQKQTVSGSLRRLKCGIPYLEFISDIEIASSSLYKEEWLLAYLEAICAAVKSIGSSRTRGLGKCELTVIGSESKKITLPCQLSGGFSEEH